MEGKVNTEGKYREENSKAQNNLVEKIRFLMKI